jgi:Sec-independent protein translocase protein TatA
MIEQIFGLLPMALLVIPVIALFRLLGSTKRLSRQTQRLSRSLAKFKSADHSDSKIRPTFIASELNEAVANRKRFLTHQAKTKREKQRRLVKRLRGLTSKESE